MAINNLAFFAFCLLTISVATTWALEMKATRSGPKPSSEVKNEEVAREQVEGVMDKYKQQVMMMAQSKLDSHKKKDCKKPGSGCETSRPKECCSGVCGPVKVGVCSGKCGPLVAGVCE